MISITFLFTAVLAVGFMWMRSQYDDMMFVPKPRDTVLVRETLAPVFGEATDDLRVVRVNRDVNAYYFVIEGQSIGALVGKMDEAEWAYTRESEGDKIITGQSSDDREYTLVLEPLGDELIYGGLAYGETESFWAHYERDKDYAN